MSSRSSSQGQDSSSSPSQKYPSNIYVKGFHGSGNAVAHIGSNISGSSGRSFKAGGTIYLDSVTATGNQQIHIGNDHRSPPPVSPAPTAHQDSWTVRFTKAEGGIRIEGPGSPSDGTVVPKDMDASLKLNNEQKVMVRTESGKQRAIVLSPDHEAFLLIFDPNWDEVVHLNMKCEVHTLQNGVPHAVAKKVTVERQEDVVTVQYS